MSKFKAFLGGAKDASAAFAAEQRKKEAERQAKIAEGTRYIDDSFAQFDDPYYQTRAKAYQDYASPQLEDQYSQAKKDLTFALSRSGNLNSTLAGERMRKLREQYERNKETVGSTAQGYSNTARKNVADSRTNLINLLNSTENPQTARDEAIARAGLLAQPESFSPLGQLFLNVTQGINNATNNPSAGYGGGFGTSLFQDRGGSGSGTIVQ